VSSDIQSPQELAGRVSKLTSILDVAKAMAAARDLDLLLPLIIYEAAKVVDADRCTLFILDRERAELWSKVAQGASHEIRVKLGKGIAGSVAETGQVINITDAYADTRFNRDVDAATGYRTRTIRRARPAYLEGSRSGPRGAGRPDDDGRGSGCVDDAGRTAARAGSEAGVDAGVEDEPPPVSGSGVSSSLRRLCRREDRE